MNLFKKISSETVKLVEPYFMYNLYNQNDKYFTSITNLIIEGRYIVPITDVSSMDKIKKVKEYKESLDKIEINFYTLDLMIKLPKASDDHFYFSNKLQDTPYRENLVTDTLSKFQNYRDKMSTSMEIDEYYLFLENEKEEQIRIYQLLKKKIKNLVKEVIKSLNL